MRYRYGYVLMIMMLECAGVLVCSGMLVAARKSGIGDTTKLLRRLDPDVRKT